MKNLLSLLRTHLSAEIRSDGFSQWWASVRRHYPQLEDIESLESLCSALCGGEYRDVDFARRDRVLRVLIKEYRAEPGGFCVVALLRAYLSTIERASARLAATRWGRALGRDEVEAEAVRLFLELLASLNLETNRDVHTSLKRRLSGCLVRWARKAVTAAETERLVDPSNHGPCVAAERPKRRRDGWELDLAQLVFAELVSREVLDERARDLLAGKVLDHRSLSELTNAVANSNRPASYEATKKQVQRAEARIRAHLATEDVSLVELAISSFERVANSNVPFGPKAGSEEERNQ